MVKIVTKIRWLLMLSEGEGRLHPGQVAGFLADPTQGETNKHAYSHSHLWTLT